MNRLTLKLVKSPLGSLIFGATRFGHSSKWIGIFSTWAEAMAVIPTASPVGYDQEEATRVYLTYPTALVRPGDYPVLLHLRNILTAGARVLDVGGSIGMTYYMAQKFYTLPESLDWVVFDVPAVLEAGRQVALREGGKSKGLRFVDSLGEAGPCDVFCSTGALQLIEEPLTRMLEQLPQLPGHILLNRIPVWEGKAIVTLNDQGFSICPYKIFNRGDFVHSLEQLGYKLVDDWECPESKFSIRFQPRTRLDSYRGFYFRRNA